MKQQKKVHRHQIRFQLCPHHHTLSISLCLQAQEWLIDFWVIVRWWSFELLWFPLKVEPCFPQLIVKFFLLRPSVNPTKITFHGRENIRHSYRRVKLLPARMGVTKKKKKKKKCGNLRNWNLKSAGRFYYIIFLFKVFCAIFLASST